MGSRPFGRGLAKVLSLALIASVTLASVLYLQLRETSASLSGCREALYNARSELESLGLYARGLYANCTRVFEFAESLLVNYTNLVEAYNALLHEHESALLALGRCQELYEELRSAHVELKAMYDNATKQLEVLGELIALVKLLRSHYLAGHVLDLYRVNGSLTRILSNSTHALRLHRSWNTTLLARVPTPIPGYLLINYVAAIEIEGAAASESEAEICLEVSATNTYIVPGLYTAEDKYFHAVNCTRAICQAAGDGLLVCSVNVGVIVPVFPHNTALSVSPLLRLGRQQYNLHGCLLGYVPDPVLCRLLRYGYYHVRYFMLVIES